MTKLSVNVNKIATIRNARGGNNPDVLKVALDCENFGAQGITVHPRPDERHIRKSDVYSLKKNIKTEFNIEGYPSKDFIKMVIEVKPAQVTLVPDLPDAITSNSGWDTKKNKEFLTEIISEFQKNGIRTSVFVDTNLQNIEYAKLINTDRIELYTEPYAANYLLNKEEAIKPFVIAANLANKLGLGLNAGHDLSLVNLKYFANNIPNLLEVSIGHALICDALYFGLENTIKLYLGEL
ncbi:MAG: pyridoxine 5'-phosphate synthase [Bacteroidetes bacterium CG02_land_8_20_14_3_00_31_25]|nr:MAG: pyridoxine 5'-phosphate synthase [Bacteroidetes bacterium CG02_land_8_20_14_3_00_31_25]